MAEGVRKSFRKSLIHQMYNYLIYHNTTSVKRKQFEEEMLSYTTIDSVRYSDGSVKAKENKQKSWDTIREAIERYNEKHNISLPIGVSSFDMIYELACQEVEEETQEVSEQKSGIRRVDEKNKENTTQVKSGRRTAIPVVSDDKYKVIK